MDELSVEDHASLDVGDALNTEAVNNILGDDDIRNSLFPFVNATSSKRTPEEVHQLVEDQQFQNRLQVIHKAIQQDSIDNILEELHAEKSK